MQDIMLNKLKELRKHILPNGLLKFAPVADFLGMHLKTLYAIKNTENAPPYLELGKRLFYDINDIIKWLQVCKHNQINQLDQLINVANKLNNSADLHQYTLKCRRNKIRKRTKK